MLLILTNHKTRDTRLYNIRLQRRVSYNNKTFCRFLPSISRTSVNKTVITPTFYLKLTLKSTIAKDHKQQNCCMTSYKYKLLILFQMKVYKHKIVARFGLMHMVGTNLSVWLNVLVQETKHEILTFYDPENKTIGLSHRLGKTLVL